MIPRVAIPIGNDEIITILRLMFAGADAVSDNVAKFENELVTYLGNKKVFTLNSGRTARADFLKGIPCSMGFCHEPFQDGFYKILILSGWKRNRRHA